MLTGQRRERRHRAGLGLVDQNVQDARPGGREMGPATAHVPGWQRPVARP
jgi:hypothetical protein